MSPIRLSLISLFLAVAPFRLHAMDQVQVEYFFASGCVSCVKINAETLPMLEQRCGERYKLIERELSVEENYLRLVEIQEKVKQVVNAPIFMAVDGRILFSGVDSIQSGLVSAVENAARNPVSAVAVRAPQQSEALLHDRMAGFRAAGVFCAGLADGLNPCAIASLVFMMGLLASAKVKGCLLATAGFFFCLSSFITYYLLGLGLLESIKAFISFGFARLWLNRVMAIALIGLAFLSFRDAWLFRRNKKGGALSLKLPEGLRERIRKLARTEIRTHPIIWATLVLGFLVTLFESVCTGQLYIPTLAWVAKTSSERGHALGLLGLYNVGFILPLVGVFGAVLSGTSIFSLLGWQEKHVARGKAALGLLFLILAAGLIRQW